MVFRSVNPYNQSVIAEFPLHDDQTINRILQKATVAYRNWRNQSFNERAACMHRAVALLRQNKEEYARIVSLEMGKAVGEARNEIEKCAVTTEYFASQAERLLADTPVHTEARKSYIAYHPVGAVFGIMPWNFPFWQVFRFVVPTVMGGNVALLKHAPNVCQVSLAIEALFLQAGFPEGVFQSLIVDVDKTERIIRDDLVQGVTLTGSEYAGSQVAALAGKHIKKSVLELGGSDALIVLEDADLEKAAKVAVQSRMQNAGQSCIASKRFLVIESVKDDFLDLVRKNVSQLTQGNPLDETVTTGPMARMDLAEKLEQQLHASVKLGARLVAGGTRDGCNFIPAILDHVQKDMPAFAEETFGPLAAVVSVKTEAEAIELANNSRYGLGASLWTRDLEKATTLAGQLEAGAVFVNALVRSDARWPFGGIKKSGYGRELAELGIKEFLNAKSVIME
jgi:succinate-semialdehyde dehydrogenase/glutarate-semialdehyde dehydrogenase